MSSKIFTAIEKIYGERLFAGTKTATDVPVSARAGALEYCAQLTAAA